jgi:hypothetical protein
MLYPKLPLSAEIKQNPDLLRRIWQTLNEISIESLLQNGRVYGGGLHKLEPNELGNISAESFLALFPEQSNQIFHQLSLFNI